MRNIKLLHLKINPIVLVVCNLILILLISCAGVSKVRYSPLIKVERPPNTIEQVEVFFTKKPTKVYKEIGILSYRAGTAEQYTDIVEYMREKASQLGADGIIMMGSSTGPSMPVGKLIATLKDYSAMAIIYEKNE